MQSWRSRLTAAGPLLVSLLLAALIAAECVRAALSLTKYNSFELLPPTHSQQPSARPALNVFAILNAHLFGVAEVDMPPGAVNAAPAASDLALFGTLAASDPRHSVAIIASNGSAKVYAIGDDVGGASLRSVYSNRVTLDRGGQLETLLLPRFATSEAEALPPIRSKKRNSLPRVVEVEPPATKLADLIGAQLTTDDVTDQLLGFVVSPGNGSRAALISAGLRPGDMITTVNGTVLADQDRAKSEDLMENMLASERASVSVLRNGKPLELLLQVKRDASASDP